MITFPDFLIVTGIVTGGLRVAVAVFVALAVVEEVTVDVAAKVRNSGDKDLVGSADVLDEGDFLEVVEYEEYAFEEVMLFVVFESRLVFER